uniref:Uncharacterized protein n=1 Tax=Arundo donax TaxID=35708 RepID=A0A0A9HBI6_ARUDO
MIMLCTCFCPLATDIVTTGDATAINPCSCRPVAGDGSRRDGWTATAPCNSASFSRLQFAEFVLACNFTEPPLPAGAAPALPALLPRRRAPSRGASRPGIRRRSSPPAPGGDSSSGTLWRTR